MLARAVSLTRAAMDMRLAIEAMKIASKGSGNKEVGSAKPKIKYDKSSWKSKTKDAMINNLNLISICDKLRL